MTTSKIQITVRMAWWLKPYVHCMALFCGITGQSPDLVKLEKVIKRAMILKVVR